MDGATVIRHHDKQGEEAAVSLIKTSFNRKKNSVFSDEKGENCCTAAICSKNLFRGFNQCCSVVSWGVFVTDSNFNPISE
jgi:hypothetical protein